MNGAISNLHPDLMTILMELEKRLGFELTIDSGYRDPQHNQDVGGVPDSEHTHDPSEGADVMCLRSITRFRMLKELLAMNVRRIGVGATFIHVGISTDLPQDVCWTYYQKA